jgi:hypothetical protein
LVLNDKEYLPMIFKKIAAVRKDAGADVATAAAMDSHPNTDLISFAPGETRSPEAARAFESRAVRDARTDRLVLASSMPQASLDTIPKAGAAQSAAKASARGGHGLVQRGAGLVRSGSVEARLRRARHLKLRRRLSVNSPYPHPAKN